MGGRSRSQRAEALLAPALGGDASALDELIDCLAPAIQERIAWTLIQRRPSWAPRDVRDQVADMTQEVFMVLFADDAKTLRGWDRERGLSLVRFAGLVAERRVTSFLRSPRRNPWFEQTTEAEILNRNVAAEGSPETEAAAKELYNALLDRLQDDLSPLGWHLFDLLFVQNLDMAHVRAETDLSEAAVYAWRSRLRKRARALAESLTTAATPAREVHHV